jgi:Xaa-Pro aminopeptidase
MHYISDNILIKFDNREQEDFVGLSFDTISASGPNGAIIHYSPEPKTCAAIDPNLLYLCDSGGQYK